MGRSLSPMLRRELENLDKDADSRKSAMKALKSYVKDLDSKAIPKFLAQMSETKQTGISSGEHTISLYEVLARVHGTKIVPQIDNIMKTIIKTLSSSAGAFALHQACSKVVPAIARYAMDPTTAEDKKRYIIHSLCKPLSNCLLSSQENLSSGAALCLQALVESDNWRFSSSELVNEVCQRVAGALEKHSQSNSQMALTAALAKHSSLIVEAYARLLIQSGLRILDAGFAEANSQKQLSAIHMVSSLIRFLDLKSIWSELELIIREMEKCQSGRMPFVTGAAFETLQIAKRMYFEKVSKFERNMGSTTGANIDRSENAWRNGIRYSGDQSSLMASPESQTVDSFVPYDYFIESPISMNQRREGTDSEHRSVNRKLWQRHELVGLDVSLKDGIFSEIRHNIMNCEFDDFSGNHGDSPKNFIGFVQESNGNGAVRSDTPSPQRQSQLSADDVKIFTTPRKLIHSLQDLDDSSSVLFKKQSRSFMSPPLQSTLLWTPASEHGKDGLSGNINCQKNSKRNFSSGDDQFYDSSESVSSMEDEFISEDLRAPEVIPGNKSPLQCICAQKDHQSSYASKIICGLVVILVSVFYSLLAVGDQNDQNILKPT